MAVKGGEPYGRLEAKGDRQRMLQMGAPGHRRIAIAPREPGEIAAQRREVGLDQRQPGTDLQHRGGIHDVLRRRPPMEPAPRLAGAFGELAHERQDRIADRLGLALEAGQIERSGVGLHRLGSGGNRGRGFRRDDADSRLSPCQRRFDLGAADEKGGVVEHRAHRGRAEHVAKQRR